MRLIQLLLFMGAVVFLEDIIRLLKDDLPVFIQKMRGLKKKKPQRKRTVTFDMVLNTRTIEEQEVILVEILSDCIPSKKLLLRFLLEIKKERLHKGHAFLFERLLCHDQLTLTDRQSIFQAYKNLSPEEYDLLFDYLNTNAKFAMSQKELDFLNQYANTAIKI